MRYKEYNVNRVLEKALILFWQKGFNGCSIKDIVESTGVNRFSLYSEFEHKENILYASLGLYRDRYCGDKLSILESDRDLVHSLKTFYMSYLEDDKQMSGCYFIHVGTELADQDHRIKEYLEQYLFDIKILIQSLLVRNNYQKHSELYAKHLVGLFCTVMSFCLVHTPKQREDYILNGINVILSKDATYIN